MAKHEFQLSNNKPSEEDIKKHKSFGRLKHKYQYAVKPHYKTRLDNPKNKRLLMIIIIIILVLILVVISESVEHDDKNPASANDTIQVDKNNRFSPD